MTREEAIRRIEEHMIYHHMGEYPHIFIGEALEMAISALREQEERSKGCAYCHHQGTIHGDDFTEIEVVKMIPLPAIDLETGEMEDEADPPYWALRITGDGEDFAEILFCPMCGRRLEEV